MHLEAAHIPRIITAIPVDMRAGMVDVVMADDRHPRPPIP